MSLPPADLADCWHEYWRLHAGTRAERKALEQGEPPDVVAAHEWVSAQVERGGAAAIRLLADLAVHASDDGVMVGVGPVEDLLHDHGDDIVVDLVAEARRVPALGRALAHVYVPDRLSAASLALLAPFVPPSP